MAESHASTIPFGGAERGVPWIAPAAIARWTALGPSSRTRYAPATSAPTGDANAPIYAVKKCPNPKCKGNPMSSEVVEEKDKDGKVIRRYTKYWCSRCGGRG